jgi:excisionase family DNA binding protein
MPIEPTEERLLSTTEVAERLGITRHAVIALIKRGSLPAQKFGVNWIVQEKDLELVKNRKVGRPKKKHNEGVTTD